MVNGINTGTDFEKHLKKINSHLCIKTDYQLSPVEILFADVEIFFVDDTNNVAQPVFDLTKGIWHTGDRYLSLNEHN